MSRKNKPDNSGFVYSTDPNFRFEDAQEIVETLPPAQQNLKVKVDTGHRAGKAVTLILGFVGKGKDLEELGKKLKTFCGTGGSVKADKILIQGDQRNKLTEWLLKNGYSKTKKL
jgi:translation initiation factor 1